jgi:hypothetical protein
MVDNFIRFVEPIKLREEEKRVVSITVRLLISDCTGTIYYTDLQLQEGDRLTGYTPHTSTMLRDPHGPVIWRNGIIRHGATILLNVPGQTSTGLDYYLYPLDSMAAESIHLATETGSHKATFRSAANAGDEFALLASGRHCLRNGSPTPKWGFFQYAAAYDSKYKVELQQGTSARLYVEFREMQEGESKP